MKMMKALIAVFAAACLFAGCTGDQRPMPTTEDIHESQKKLSEIFG